MEIGDRIELEITKVVHGGFGLGRYEGFVLFVSGTLPGEIVFAEVTRRAKSHAFANVLTITQPSPHRVPHIWPEAEYSRPAALRAGGADFGHSDLNYQRALKTEVVFDALLRQGRVDPQVLNALSVRALGGDQAGTGYRTRVTLHVDSEGVAGPYAEGTHSVVEVEGLPLATTEINELKAHKKFWAPGESLRIVHPSTGPARVVNPSEPPVHIRERVGEFEFVLDDRVFWQVHVDAARGLSEAVRTILGDHSPTSEAEHWDLYGGVGLFSRVLKEFFGPGTRVMSVESDPRASEFAGLNLADTPSARAVAMDTLGFLRAVDGDAPPGRGKVGTVVLDPPRHGAGGEVVSLITRRNPELVIYVACDPIALARDVATFQVQGYRLASADALDLFPHTHHVEVVAALVPESA